jgi:hypothetical protein
MKTQETMKAVSTAFSFTSEKISQNLVEYFRREEFELSEDQIRQVLSIVESSVGQSLLLTCSTIEKTLK